VKKTYTLQVEGKHPDRVLEAAKHEIRKYFARERRKPLPKGVDFWDFDCRFGASAETAEGVRVGAITGLINAAVADGASQFYIEIIAKPGRREPKVDVVS
jgi:hypothetical protein